MAENSTIDQVLGWLRGTPAAAAVPPPIKETMAPPLASYPSNDDAEYARKYGYGHGSGNEPFLNNEIVRSLGSYIPNIEVDKKGKAKVGDPVFANADSSEAITWARGADNDLERMSAVIADPRTNKAITPMQSGGTENLNNSMMRGALAVNRSPIAALGFDPSKMVLDTVAPKGKDYGFAGLYDPTRDNIYANFTGDTPSVITHESTHRGMKQLRKLYPQEMAKAFSVLPDEEYVVRWLMHKNAGDPENLSGGRRETAIKYFNNPDLKDKRAESLKQIEELAIEAIKNRRPRGPH